MDLDPRVRTALDELASLAPLALLTLGVPGTQRQKIGRLGIASWFAEVRLVNHVETLSKTAALASILATPGWRPHHVVAVGDSVRSDVRAGNENGCRTVLIESGGERSHEIPSGPEERPWRTCSHVAEVPALLREDAGRLPG